MKNQDQWVPSKFVYTDRRLISSRDCNGVYPGSRLTVDLAAWFYNLCIPKYARRRLLDLGCGKTPPVGVYRKHVTSNIRLWRDPDLYLGLGQAARQNGSSRWTSERHFERTRTVYAGIAPTVPAT